MAGRKPLVSEGVRQKWETYRDSRQAARPQPTLWRIATELADYCRGKYTVRTIFEYINPRAREAARINRRLAARRQAARLMCKRNYEKWYRRFERPSTLARYLDQVFGERIELALDEILAEFRVITSVKWRPCTLEKILRNFASRFSPPEVGAHYLHELSDSRWYYGPRSSEDKLLLVFSFPVLALALTA